MLSRRSSVATVRVIALSTALAAVVVCSGIPAPAGVVTRPIADPGAGVDGRCLAAQFGYRTLKRGARGEDVWNLQLLLGRLGLFSGEPTGYFGAMTESAVKRLQRARRMKPTGVISGETLEVVEMMLAALEWSQAGYEVREGDTLESIARAWGIPAAVLARLNGIPGDAGLRPGDRIRIPVPEFIVHDVRKGECLTRIASAYGIEWRDLATWNGIRPPYIIRPGDLLVIPARPMEPSDPAAPAD